MNPTARDELEAGLAELKAQIRPLEHLVGLAAATVYQPIFCDSNGPDRYFRYPSPGIQHFCILKFARVVSSLNAALRLARDGFNQEVCILIRAMIESATLIEWAIESLDPAATHKPAVDAHIAAFFADHDRSPGTPHRPAGVKQEDIHKDIAKIFDQRLGMLGVTVGKSTKELMSRTFLAYSYYVHARYPELMDMFGGNPVQLHLDGMSNTPKDRENLEILKTFVRTATLTGWHMALGLRLMPAITKHPVLSDWHLALVDEQGSKTQKA